MFTNVEGIVSGIGVLSLNQGWLCNRTESLYSCVFHDDEADASRPTVLAAKASRLD